MNKIYSLKMRAAKELDGREKHVSGAERLVPESAVIPAAESLVNRALHHSNGTPDIINLKIELQDRSDILHLDALPVRTIKTHTSQEGQEKMCELLKEIGVPHAEEIVGMLLKIRGMRGAMLLDSCTLERLEKDPLRGVRVTYMDAAESAVRNSNPEKNHFSEALILATKVVHAPNIQAEICISDDTDYCTGYVASKELGYVRITKLKEQGSRVGGRIFIYDGDQADKEKTIDYLEKQSVLVHGVSLTPDKFPEEAHLPSRIEEIRDDLNKLKEKHLHRSMLSIEGTQGTHVKINENDVLMFSSNNYLDLANDARLKAATVEALEKYGVGAGGSRLISGNMQPHRDLESLVAKFKGTEAAITFATGYMANVGCIQALCGEGDVIFSDELNHASIIDGCRLSRAHIVVYKHCDMEDLENKIRKFSNARGMVVSDAVFSMDGDIAPLPELLEISKRYGLITLIDEAHATGVIGATGHGICEHFNLTVKPDILMGTFSKAVGSQGGFCCAGSDIIDYIKNRARSFIFSTAPSPAIAAASSEGISIIMSEPWRVKSLQKNMKLLCKIFAKHGVAANSDSAILPVILGEESKAMEMSLKLLQDGILVSAIRYPTVKRGSARLRIALMAAHTEDEIKRVVKSINKYI